MNKGSITKFVKGETTHRFPKVVTLAVTSCALVAMVAIDASASPSGTAPAVTGTTTHAYVFASESGLSQLIKFGLDRQSPINPTSTDTTVAPGGGGGNGGGGNGGGSAAATTTPPVAPTTTPPVAATTTPPVAPTTTPPVATTTTPPASGGLITAGPSRSECLIATTAGPGLSALNAAVTSFDTATGTSVSCIGTYMNTAQTWTDWSDPWIVGSSGSAYTSWVAADPQNRQLTLQVDLIPLSLKNISNPLGWEQSCAAGDFNSYATALGTNLVAAGLQNTVLRIGAEMNGPWETDFVGTTTQEQSLWAKCFDNEVTALRQATGEHFLIDWNPNACYENIPFANYYPGNAYVDIMGLDLYNKGCTAPTTQLTFAQLASEPGGLTSFEAFASAQGKPMSLPEWGLTSSPSGDDPGYINGIGSTVANGNYAFQEYFDMQTGGTILLGSGTSQSLAGYHKWFG